VYTLDLIKPDGRRLTLYSRKPIAPQSPAPSPFAEPLNASPHLRWHPLRGEWVTYAAMDVAVSDNRLFPQLG
jgi:UDPglucose--hexose-1-phosphate uridylyltransferase